MARTDVGASPADTFPKLMLAHALQRGDKPSIREKNLGIWQTSTWRQVAEEVRALACGLAAMGFKRGDHLAIIGDNRPRLYWAMTAAQSLGGVPVPLYQDSVAQEMIYVMHDGDIAFAIVEDQEQVDKMLEIQTDCPTLKNIVYDDPRGLRNYHQPQLLSYESLQQVGREYDKLHPEFFEQQVKLGQGDDIAIMLYTSGTTGKPKGVRLTHNAVINSAHAYAQLENLTENDTILSYLPMAWVGDNLFSYAQAYVTGFSVNCPESSDTVMTDMREIGPTYYFAPPRVFENLLTQVMIRMEDAGAIKRKLFHYFMGVAKRVGTKILNGDKSVSIVDSLLYALGNLFIYAPLRNVLGMSRVRVAYTAGEAIGPDLFSFYRSLGINLKQLYGSTETCVLICIQPDGQVKADTVGPPVSGVEIKLTDSGEVLVKTPGIFKEYYKRPDATAEVFDAEGWYHTGDAGYFDKDGHLKIIDRVKDVGKMAGGALFAPKYVENKLKFFQHIKEAVVFGNARDEVTAFINIDLEAVGNWAERRNLAYSGYTDLAQQPSVYELITGCVEQVNRDLSQDTALYDSQIRRFLILHKELDPDDDELTRTRKVRRGFIAEKYKVLIDALYSGKPLQYIETQVKFEDGRSGIVSAEIKIQPVQSFVATKAAA
ncbi:MAG: AMP-binding protein [Burkholderiales bacterium]